jgi:hypothetical protein
MEDREASEDVCPQTTLRMSKSGEDRGGDPLGESMELGRIIDDPAWYAGLTGLDLPLGFRDKPKTKVFILPRNRAIPPFAEWAIKETIVATTLAQASAGGYRLNQGSRLGGLRVSPG